MVYWPRFWGFPWLQFISQKNYDSIEMKRKTVVLALLAAGLYFSYLAVISWLSGFLMAKYGGGKGEGMRGRVRSVMIPLGRRRLHLHHWFICSVMMALGLTKSIPLLFFPPEIFYGLLGGLAFQGVYCYNDWYRIIHKSPTNL